ncbi:GGDEF domain-containing protein [Salinibacterium sp. SYSU T00001]|uniref:GGDEF domain-containing protein n=1 Tax=Homoserinimonas sedimenticola TaxID=2986805 RepID=UPI0022354EAB|nr:GGDEF domain-containing protein [Salinibacterium sedimenticola]MCW4385993.1 GGDEF domain-containing protein [Salinibacterium sedimenticola]
MPEPVRSDSDRPLLSVSHFGLPGPVWTMVLVQAGGVLLLAFGLFFPAHPGHNPQLKAVAAIIGLGMLVSLLILRRRTPAWLLWAELLAFIALAALLISVAPTEAGAVSLMLGMLIAGVYAGLWGSRRAAVAVFAAIVVAGTVAIHLGGRYTPSLGSAWLMVIVLGAGLIAVIQMLVSALEQQALIDPLSGVMNRRGLQALTQVRQASGRRLHHRSIVLIDVDDFKLINDGSGHAQGDRVLRELAAHWVAGLRSDDIVVRLGGDEFVIVLTRVDADAAAHLMERLREGSVAPWTYGIAPWPDGADFDECLAVADDALLEKKRARGVTR